jgi:hypothetical protein
MATKLCGKKVRFRDADGMGNETGTTPGDSLALPKPPTACESLM